MNGLKSGLLGTAALLMAAQAASADELSALKAEIEALNARISQIEAAPAVPAGYQLLTITETDASPFVGEKASDFVGRDRKATVIGILPTADMPATTTIEWHGQIRTALTYTDAEDWDITSSTTDAVSVFDNDDLDVNTRGRLWVRATTDTAVGEVGVEIRLESDVGIADAGEELNMDIAWGWWQMTPNWQAAAGYAASLAAVPHGMDEQTTFGATGGVTNRDVDQRRLTYSNGPLSIAISSEDSEADSTGGAVAALDDYTGAPSYTASGLDADRGDMPATAVRVSYAGDQFSASISGIWQDDDGHTLSYPLPTPTSFAAINGDDDWFVGGGATYAGDMFLLSVAGGAGEGYAGAYNGAEAPANDDSYWGASIFARINVSDSAFVELGYGYSELDWLETYDLQWTGSPTWVQGGDVDTHTINVGFYYNPVSQLTIGLQGDYRIVDYDLAFDTPPPITYDFETETFTASFITWFSF